MSNQVGSTCYSSPLDAVAAIASSQVGNIVQAGPAAYVVNVSSYDATSITYAYQPISGGAAFATTAQITPLPCGLLDTADGLVIAWGIATAWLCTAGILFLRRGIHE